MVREDSRAGLLKCVCILWGSTVQGLVAPVCACPVVSLQACAERMKQAKQDGAVNRKTLVGFLTWACYG